MKGVVTKTSLTVALHPALPSSLPKEKRKFEMQMR